MSINRSEETIKSGDFAFRKYSVNEGSSNSLSENTSAAKAKVDNNSDFYFYSLTPGYVIPLPVVRNTVDACLTKVLDVYTALEERLYRAYINPFLDSDIEEAHFHIWNEIKKNNETLFKEFIEENKETISIQIVDENGNPIVKSSSMFPDYCSFGQYLYAENNNCRGCRKFVKEYDRLISHSIFVHLFDFRYYLKLLSNEAKCIKNSLLYDFGDEYVDESQEQTAAFYYSWAKMAENHTRLITEEFTQQADKLPTSEVDIISKKQAAQFQAFFSIRVASYTETIDNLLFSLKKDLVDNCDLFYNRYVSPALKFKTQLAMPLQLDIETTNMSVRAPILSEEIITAVNAIKGNYGSLLSDMVQRRTNLNSKFDKLFSFITQRRKYISYIDDLSSKGSQRPNIIKSIEDDKYLNLFSKIATIDESEKASLKSSHSNLDDLDENHHPQYLLRSGGLITGNVTLADGVTIDGVDISEHSHDGLDGSAKIKSTDIDYETAREQIDILKIDPQKDITVSIDSFSPDIRLGGTAVVDAVVTIEVPDEVKDKYEYEILYVES